MLKEVTTIDEAIAALGGPTAAGRQVGKTAQHANSWRIAGQFPSKTYLVLSKALEARGYTAHPRLWGMVEQPPSEEAA